MRIEVICTGDEVLTGKIINTNFSYMSQKLEDVGLAVQWETTVGDDRESLLLAFKLAGERADAVIVNGGLGPTVDDLSQEVAAQAAAHRHHVGSDLGHLDGDGAADALAGPCDDGDAVLQGVLRKGHRQTIAAMAPPANPAGV